MNIFFLSLNAKRCAQYACDKHIVKMILESTQMLYAAQHLLPSRLHLSPLTPYKLAHKNHPCTIWTRTSLSNYMWLCTLAFNYCEEYRFRYGPDKIHACEVHLQWLYANPPELKDIGFTEPAQAMPDQYKHESVVKAYRRYYLGEKMSFVKYTRREVPSWILKAKKK
jgi:hypothetical protein